MPIYKILLGIAALFALYKMVIKKRVYLLGVFVVFIAILEIIAANFFSYYYENNLIIYTIISYFSVFFYLVYFRIPKDSIKMYTVYILLFIFWQIFAIWNFIWGEGVENVNINTYNLGMIISIILIIQWFYRKLYIDNFEQLFLNPKLYVGFGILIFYTCSFTILNFINYLIVDDNFKKIYSDLLKIGNIFLSLGYFGAILCSIRKTYYTI